MVRGYDLRAFLLLENSLQRLLSLKYDELGGNKLAGKFRTPDGGEVVVIPSVSRSLNVSRRVDSTGPDWEKIVLLPTAPQAILIDLAGVLHIDDEPIPGAADALVDLRARGLPIRFLTNTTRSPRSRIVVKLRQMGFAVEADEILTAVLATRNLVQQRNLHPHYLVHPDIAEEIGCSHAEPDAVVLGDAGHHFNFESLNRVFRLLMQGLPFIVMARNRYFMEIDGLTLDMGAFVAGLEYSSGKTAEVVGKPAIAFFRTALDELGLAPEQAVLIGDDLADDIGGAQAAGIPGILVRTGKFRATDERHPQIRPALILDDFPEAVARILGG